MVDPVPDDGADQVLQSPLQHVFIVRMSLKTENQLIPSKIVTSSTIFFYLHILPLQIYVVYINSGVLNTCDLKNEISFDILTPLKGIIDWGGGKPYSKIHIIYKFSGFQYL